MSDSRPTFPVSFQVVVLLCLLLLVVLSRPDALSVPFYPADEHIVDHRVELLRLLKRVLSLISVDLSTT